MFIFTILSFPTILLFYHGTVSFEPDEDYLVRLKGQHFDDMPVEPLSTVHLK